MRKSEVYSWRVEPDVKSALEDAARSERTSVGRLLDRIVREWLLQRKDSTLHEETEQLRIREEAARYVGSVALGCGPYSAERVRQRIRRKRERKDAGVRPR